MIGDFGKNQFGVHSNNYIMKSLLLVWILGIFIFFPLISFTKINISWYPLVAIICNSIALLLSIILLLLLKRNTFFNVFFYFTFLNISPLIFSSIQAQSINLKEVLFFAAFKNGEEGIVAIALICSNLIAIIFALVLGKLNKL